MLFLMKKLDEGDEGKFVETAEKFQAAIQRTGHLGLTDHRLLVRVGFRYFAGKDQLVIYDLDPVVEVDDAAVDAFSVDVGSLGAGEIQQHKLSAGKLEHGVLTADLIIVQDNIIGIEPPDVQNRVWRDLIDSLIIDDEISD